MTKCPAYDKWNTELPLTECEKHIKKWGYVLIQCEHCSKMIERRKIELHVSKWDEIEIVWDWWEQVLKRKFYEHHINNKWKEYSIRCNRCNRTFKRRDEDMHDCIRHLTNWLKNANDEIKILKSQLQENKKFNEALLNEFAVIKILLSKKLKITPESMNYCQKFKQIKIVDNIKTYINETQYSLLDTPFWFDISFETRNLEDENLLWNAYFSEENKEDNKISLKSMVIKHRAGSVQIKLNVPPPEFEKINVEGIISNGWFVSLVWSLNDHILHEVRYYYDVMKSENSGLNEDEISILRTRSGIPFKTLSSKSVIIPKIELLRKILKRSDIETAYNYTIESDLNLSNFVPLDSALLDTNANIENVEYYISGSSKEPRIKF